MYINLEGLFVPRDRGKNRGEAVRGTQFVVPMHRQRERMTVS